MEGNNLIKKELVFGIILLLLLTSIPYVTSDHLSSISSYGNDLVVTLMTDKLEYNIGEPVEVTISVTNTGDEDITIVFPDAQLVDYWVNRGEVYIWSYYKYFAQVITPVTIPSGETFELLNDKWRQVDNRGIQVPAGDYEIDGWIVDYNIHGEPISISIVTGEFNIDYRPWYFGKLWFDIENIGGTDAINVSWRFGIDYISINPPTWNGVIENLSVGDIERISSDWFIFAPIGIHDIIIELNATDIDVYTRIIRGLFLGPFIWIPKPFLPLRCEIK
jgi:hypothetical protein